MTRAARALAWSCIDAIAHLLHPTFAPWHLIPTRTLDWVCDHYDRAIGAD